MSDAYHVVITREDDAWLARVEGLEGAQTFARSLPSLMKSIREVIVLMDDLPDDSPVTVNPTYDLQDPLLLEAAFTGQERRALEARISDLQASTATIARNMTAAGWSVRDTAALLDITPGRVSQVAPSERRIDIAVPGMVAEVNVQHIKGSRHVASNESKTRQRDLKGRPAAERRSAKRGSGKQT
jgi:predicted RNase H-like HicB family nuclease